jgi:hypothetical protein
VIGDEPEREVGAQERRLDDHHRDREQRGDRVHRAPRRVDPAAIPAGARERRAGRVQRHDQRQDQAG